MYDTAGQQLRATARAWGPGQTLRILCPALPHRRRARMISTIAATSSSASTTGRVPTEVDRPAPARPRRAQPCAPRSTWRNRRLAPAARPAPTGTQIPANIGSRAHNGGGTGPRVRPWAANTAIPAEVSNRARNTTGIRVTPAGLGRTRTSGHQSITMSRVNILPEASWAQPRGRRTRRSYGARRGAGIPR